jgi:hypothetical protein
MVAIATMLITDTIVCELPDGDGCVQMRAPRHDVIEQIERAEYARAPKASESEGVKTKAKVNLRRHARIPDQKMTPERFSAPGTTSFADAGLRNYSGVCSVKAPGPELRRTNYTGPVYPPAEHH